MKSFQATRKSVSHHFPGFSPKPISALRILFNCQGKLLKREKVNPCAMHVSIFELPFSNNYSFTGLLQFFICLITVLKYFIVLYHICQLCLSLSTCPPVVGSCCCSGCIKQENAVYAEIILDITLFIFTIIQCFSLLAFFL